MPVKHKALSQLICDTEIDYSTDWPRLHLNRFADNYRRAPFFECAHELLKTSRAFSDRTISELNIRLIREICIFLGIDTPLRLSIEYSVSGMKTERLIAILRRTKATIYLSGPAAKSYLDQARFGECGMELEYKSYEYASYPQLWGEFDGAVSVLDLIANVGPNAHKYLTCLIPDIRVSTY